MNLVDSSVWLACLADEPAADFFAEAIEDADLLLVPPACIHAVFKVVLRERGEDEAFSAAAAMQQSTVIDLDADSPWRLQRWAWKRAWLLLIR